MNYSDNKTIFAPSTAVTKSGTATIRISGKDAFNAIEALAHLKALTPRKATLSKLYDPENKEMIDTAIILWFPAPKSFTGEDIVEFHTHGSIAVINSMMEALSKMPFFRLAEPGEFSRRAFLNNKLDLTAAEGLADLIDAETKMQQRQALRQMSGELANIYENWRQELIHIMALLEAYIDFPEEDIPKTILQELDDDIAKLKKSINAHLNDSNRGERIRGGIYGAILGEPNVGKSSLMNYLARRDVAIVSEVAGTTRDVIEVYLDIYGYPVTLADTAGIRDTMDEVESEGVRRSLSSAQNADFKILILTEESEELVERLADENTIIVCNKADLYPASTKYLNISVTQTLGLEELLEAIKFKLDQIFPAQQTPNITRTRHRHHLQETVSALNYFSTTKPIEFAAEDLRIAARELGKITGIIDIEQILDEIFLKFCIGK